MRLSKYPDDVHFGNDRFKVKEEYGSVRQVPM